ncbi:MAG: NAD-dependent epimerase/dehydratase family protein [Candidatus Limnocylindrales bacterium]
MTGGAGMIGATVVRALLARGDEVVVLDSGAAAGFTYLAGTDAKLVEADIRDRGALESATAGCAAIVHLAAQASVPNSIADPINDLQINVDASVSLLEVAREAGVGRYVFASSNAVIGGHEPPAHEELVPFPVSPYGAAKAAIEAYLRAYHEAFGVDTVSLRFANAYGPWSAHKSAVVAAFVKKYLSGGPLRINGTGQQTRDFVHVDDVAAVVLACLDAPADVIANQILQVGTGAETSLLELADVIFDAGGGSVAVEHGPESPGDVARNVSDITKARRLLGYEPRVPLRDGIADTLQWFRDNWRP